MIPVRHPLLPPGARLWGAGRPGYPDEPPAPEAVEAGVRAWRDAGVDVVVSLMEDREVPSRAPRLYEALACHAIDVRRFPIVDFGAPVDPVAFSKLLGEVRERLTRGQGVLVHCNAGLGRTAVFLASMLVTCGYAGDAIAEIRRIYQPGAMREPAQEAFIRSLPLGLKGRPRGS